MRPDPTPTVVYVSGYGRSGSTLLDMLLASAEGAWGGGELCWLFEEREAGRDCSCGLPIETCPFWTAVFDDLARRDLDLAGAAEVTRRAQRVLLPARSHDARYAALWRATHQAIRAVSGCSVIIDSSKSTRDTARRASLLRQGGERLRAVHLVRHPEAVLSSVRKGSNKKLERGEPAAMPAATARAVLGWMAANWMVERSAGEDRTLVRYEDVVSDPESELARIGRALAIDLGPTIAKVQRDEPFSPGHAIAGNRMRRGGDLRLGTSAAVPPPLVRPREMLWGGMARRYGYD